MAEVSKINGISIYAAKSVSNTRVNTVKSISSSPDILKRAMCWTIKYGQNSSNQWLCTHTASAFDVENPTNVTEENYAPSGSWDAFWQNGYGNSGMSAQTFGVDSLGIYWWGAVRSNDIIRAFMHTTSSQVVDGNLQLNTDWAWPYDASGMSNPRRMKHVTFGAFDRVWLIGKGGTHDVESLNISYSDPQQTNNQMSFEQIPNFNSGDIRECIPIYCGHRKYAAVQGNSFFINTGSLSSSVADANQWIKRTDPGITEGSAASYAAYGNHPEYPDGVFVVLGKGNREIKVSTDNGASWSSATVGGGGTTRPIQGVCYDSRRRQFIAVGNFGTILTSSASDVTEWAVAGGNSDYNGDAGSTHYGVSTDGFNVVVTGLNEIKISTGSLEVFETIPYFTSKTSGKSVGSEGTLDNFNIWGATPSKISLP